MMRLFAAAVMLALAPLCASAAPIDECKPQPDCQLLFLPLKPGAPKGPLNPTERRQSDLRVLAPSEKLLVPKAPERFSGSGNSQSR